MEKWEQLKKAYYNKYKLMMEGERIKYDDELGFLYFVLFTDINIFTIKHVYSHSGWNYSRFLTLNVGNVNYPMNQELKNIFQNKNGLWFNEDSLFVINRTPGMKYEEIHDEESDDYLYSQYIKDVSYILKKYGNFYFFEFKKFRNKLKQSDFLIPFDFNNNLYLIYAPETEKINNIKI